MRKHPDNPEGEDLQKKIDNILKNEKRHWQSQKIDALGRLAGGVAHDFNNFLAVILLHVDMLNLQLEADSPHRSRINEIKEVSNNAAATVRQLMAFGRKLPMSSAPVALNPLVKDFSEQLSARLDPKIKLEISLEPNLGTCFVDSKQIMQVLTNLTANANEAMPNGGTLKVETSNIKLDKKTMNLPQTGDSFVQIIVSDNGVGMDADTKYHVFEPFFSTKESSKGAGLGLAVVYGIVKQLKGFIWVESEIGRSTTFKIQFPRIDEAVQVETTETAPKILPAPPVAKSGGKTILLVDDERSVRLVMAEVLKISGYKVFEAGNGMEALEFVQSFSKPIDLLLTDLSMPLMNGREVAEKIKAIHPGVLVLYMSGTTENVDSEDQEGGEKINFIGKPFSPMSLAAKVGEILKG